MKQLRVAILGQGRSGRDIHGAHLIQVPDMYKIVAVVDPLEERRRRAEKEYGCETFENHSSLIGRNDLDIVINATPSHFHVPITMELLNGGLNVLCDKPFARTVKEVDMLIETAKKSRKTLAVFQQSRYAPYFQQVKKVIASGVLGRIIQISSEWNGFSRRWDWQCVQEYNGGSLRNTGPHPVDQLLRLLDFNGMPEVM
jgi:predicted dehydrogenase